MYYNYKSVLLNSQKNHIFYCYFMFFYSSIWSSIFHSSYGIHLLDHLSAGHLAGLFVKLFAQTHPLQRFRRPSAPLRPGNAGDGQSQLHVGKDGLVRDKVVALEHEADGVVAVGVPIPVVIFPGGDAVDDQISAVIAVKAADDIQQRRFARAAGPEDGDKLIVPQVQADAVQRGLNQCSGFILLENLPDLKHACHLINHCFHHYIRNKKTQHKLLMKQKKFIFSFHFVIK